MTEQTDEKTTYRIPEWHLTELKSKLAKLNRKATACGSEPITLTEVGMETSIVTRTKRSGDKVSYEVRLALVEVTGVAPKMDGWTLVGTIAHRDTGNVFFSVPGERIPEEYRFATKECAYCGKAKKRTETFVVRNDQDYRQVGRQCLRNFLGHQDPKQITAYAEMVAQLREDLELSEDINEESMERFYRQGDILVKPEAILAYTFAAVRVKGSFISGSKAKQAEQQEGRHVQSTYGVVMYRMGTEPTWTYRGKTDYKGKDEWDALKPTDEDKAKADEALTWVRSLDPKAYETNDYMLNLIYACRQENAKWKEGGIIASLAAVWFKEQETKAEREAREARKAELEAKFGKRTHLGTVGEKLTLTVICTKIHPVEGQYGTTYITKFETEEGDQVTWFASRYPGYEVEQSIGRKVTVDLKEGNRVTVVAKVKEHKEYKGNAETVITRAKVALAN